MNATPSSPKGSYGPPTAASSSADSPNPQPHNAQDELSRQPLRAGDRGALARSRGSMLTALSWDDDAHERGRERRHRASTDLSFLRRHGSPRRDLERHRLWLRVREPRLRCLRRRRRVLAGHGSWEVTRPRSGGGGRPLPSWDGFLDAVLLAPLAACQRL